ncbi:MAG: hypothetical protein KAR42_11370 [candidate division Zixibacteria bacterium]|nr:hypothetical protein [candidate division Zixibacteria bacterium]
MLNSVNIQKEKGNSLSSSKSDRKVVNMLSSTAMNSVGLCSTCNNAATCGYRSGRGFDAMYCELFDSFTVSGNGQQQKSKVSVAAGRGYNSDASCNGLKGLCMNCESRSACFLPKPDGGIWHCEEYR